MENPSACFELTSGKIKFLVGYELDKRPIVVYSKEEANPYMKDDGSIADMNGLIELLKKFTKIQDEAARISLTLENICLVFPSNGLSAFTISRATYGSDNNADSPIINRTDVINVLSQMVKQTPPKGSAIVDINPEAYILDGKRSYSEPPIGERSTTLTIRGRIFCLPQNYVHQYKTAFERAGFRITSIAINNLAQAELFKTYKDFPENYLLLDIGDNITTLSLIGAGVPYNGIFFCRAGRLLSHHIAQNLLISFDDAERIKTQYGFDKRKISYDPPICKSSRGSDIRQGDLNAAIISYFEEYFPYLDSAMKQVSDSIQGGNIASLPIIVVGGSSKLNGIDKILRSHYPNRDIRFITPYTIGARDPGYCALLGLVLTSFNNRNSVKGELKGVVSLSREKEELKQEAKPQKKRSLFNKKKNEDEDII